ncbi:MAG TPA: sodium:solute symporter [Chitinophagaceae bacterium]|nr:sodium:solute symporter [Chitinophagaceae bacterium]
MSRIDWIILALTLGATVMYGVYKSRTTRNLDGYFRGNREMPWYLVLLSIMGTQASAVTFLSAPGQAYTDGMRFVQYYFGLPLAMVVLCITFVPIFRKLNLYTAYEFLEKRFDVRTRTLTSALFMISRGLSTGISVYAPSIILSSLLGWNIYWTNAFMGGLLIIYTVSGGAKAVAHTQKLQLIIVFIGLFIAAYTCVNMLPEGIGFSEALHIGGKMGKMNVISTGITDNGFDWTDRFNIFSGVIGGFFLALSYFGTDQSQVGRFLTAKSDKESKLGLLMNGVVKVPMQFLILLIGILLFTFYQFNQSPLLFNTLPLERARTHAVYGDSVRALEKQHVLLAEEKKLAVTELSGELKTQGNVDTAVKRLAYINARQEVLRREVRGMIKQSEVGGETNDTNYIFLRFVIDHLPRGLIGLLIAVIFLAAWGSIAAALNSLASASVVDIHKKFIQKDLSEEQDYKLSKWYSLFWGLFCVATAMFVPGMGSLIEAVNVLGSWFYGIILGIFLVAFYIKTIGGRAIFWGAIISQILVLLIYWQSEVAWLWLNVIGAALVIGISFVLNLFSARLNTQAQ